MKRLVWFASNAILVGCALANTLGGCGSSGDDSSGIGATDASASGDSTTGEGGSAADGSTNTDGGSTTDGSTGPVSNPGEVTCGAEPACSLDGGAAIMKPYCCERGDGGDSCETNGAACNNSVRLSCDEPADCPANRKCCLGIIIVGGTGPGHDGGTVTGDTNCQPNCVPEDLELCKTSSQCGDGGTCALVTCNGGDTFYACNTTADCK